jgi:hypothetical protein
MRRLFSSLLLILALTGTASAAELGGCFGTTDICARPDIAVGLVSYNLVTHRVDLGALPVGAAGYQFTGWSSQWFRTGIGAYLAAQVGPSGNSAAMAVVMSFAGYLRLGALVRSVGDSAQWSLLAGVGLGGNQTSTASIPKAP